MSERSIFMAALEHDAPTARSAYLDEACRGDAALRQRVEALLASHEQGGSFLGKPVPARLAENPVPPGRPEETCGEAPAAAERPRPFPEGVSSRIGPYKLLQEIGEGGMGTVYLAEQSEPVRRLVALKIIKPGMDSRQVIARFEAERQALALMDHPNIARVLDAGATEGGRPYFVMELVKGVPITKFCDERRLTPRQRLELFLPVCQAVQHAHQKGIIHRDLKPSNVLVCLYDGKPVPKVIDFGIAKATGQKLTERTMFTEIGQVVGTLEYMSPEQAELNQLDIDTRSDVYSLGVLLYELLTGSTPLQRKQLKSAAMLEVLRLIREEEPPRPSTRLSTTDEMPSVAANRSLEPKKLSGLVRGELDWIVMKALEKDRNRRYETANGFAMDVQRYLADEPVQACPPSTLYRLRKFTRRNKMALTTLGFVALALVLGTGISVWQAIRAVEAEGTAEAQRQQAVKDKEAAEQARQQARAEEQKAGEARGLAERRRDQAEWLAYTGQIALAHVEWQYGGSAAIVRDHLGLCPRHLRGWEYDYLANLLHKTTTLRMSAGGLRSVAFSPDGKRLVTAHAEDCAASVWDLDKRTDMVSLAARTVGSADGKLFVAAHKDGTLTVWDMERRPEFLAMKGPARPVAALAISPDGKCIVAGFNDGTIAVFDGERRRETLSLKGHAAPVIALAISPAGKRIVSASQDCSVKVWDAERGSELLPLKGHARRVTSLAISPDGKSIVATSSSPDPHAGLTNAVMVWDAERGGPPLTHKWHQGLNTTLVAFSADGKRILAGTVHAVKVWDRDTRTETLSLTASVGTPGFIPQAFSPDGRRIVTSWNGTLTVWDAERGSELFTLKGHKGEVRSVAFSPDGKRIASASQDCSVKVWDVERGGELFTLKGHTDDVWQVAFSPDGKRIASGSGDGTFKIWDLEQADDPLVLKGHTGRVRSVAISPDGKRIASAAEDGTVRVWDAVRGCELFTIPKHSAAWGCAAYSPDGKRIVSTWGNGVKVWDAESGSEILSMGHRRQVITVAYSPDDKRIASASYDGTVKVWDAATGRETLSDKHNEDPQIVEMHVSFSPDGKRIASTGSGVPGKVKVWDVERGSVLFTLEGHAKLITRVAYSPDGKRIASAAWDGTVKVWDAERGRELSTLKGHNQYVGQVVFSPDGKRLVTSSHDKTIRVWDVERGTAIFTLKGHSAYVISLAISPDGKRIASGGSDSSVKLWDTVWGSETLTLQGHRGPVNALLFSPDGKRIISGGNDGTVRIWKADRAARP